MPRTQLRTLSQEVDQKRGKSESKPGIGRNGRKFGYRIQAREFRRRREPESSILFSRLKKSARGRGRGWPLHDPWLLTNMAAVFTSKPKKGRAQPLLFAFLTMARLLPPKQ